MNAMEKMVATVLRALDVDPEAIKAEVVGRVVQFEKNIETLNATLIGLHARQERLEHKVDALMHHLKIPAAKPNGEITDARRIDA